MPLPVPPIQIRPPGLLSLLGLQNGGRNPDTLRPETLPTFELADWYLRAAQEVLTPGNAAITNGFSGGFNVAAAFTVPQGEWWWFQFYSGQLVTAGADTVTNWCLSILMVNSDFILSPMQSNAAGDNRFAKADAPFWAPPGSKLGFSLQSAAIAGASNFQGRGLVTKVKV